MCITHLCAHMIPESPYTDRPTHVQTQQHPAAPAPTTLPTFSRVLTLSPLHQHPPAPPVPPDPPLPSVGRRREHGEGFLAGGTAAPGMPAAEWQLLGCRRLYIGLGPVMYTHTWKLQLRCLPPPRGPTVTSFSARRVPAREFGCRHLHNSTG